MIDTDILTTTELMQEFKKTEAEGDSVCAVI